MAVAGLAMQSMTALWIVVADAVKVMTSPARIAELAAENRSVLRGFTTHSSSIGPDDGSPAIGGASVSDVMVPAVAPASVKVPVAAAALKTLHPVIVKGRATLNVLATLRSAGPMIMIWKAAEI